LSFELVHDPEREQQAVAEPDFARWRSPEGKVVASFHRLPEGYLLRFVDRADFVADLDGRLVTCRPVPGMSARAIEDLYLNQVMPVLAGHGGELVIHASGNVVGDAAVAFVGRTGRGKSTLAASLARAGFPFMSDDGVHLRRTGDGYLAHPNRASFRLWMDSLQVILPGDAPGDLDEETKTRVAASAALPFHDREMPLRALYLLGPGDAADVSFARMAERDALAELVDHSFFLDADDRDRMARHFETVAQLAETIPVFALDYPRDYDALPRVVEAIRAHAAATGEPEE
jgi:hypothetical protein